MAVLLLGPAAGTAGSARVAAPGSTDLTSVGVSSTATSVAPALEEGGFIVDCGYSHANNFDPILRPGVLTPGHLHHYFGNPDTDAFSTPESLRESTSSTCLSKPENKSSYWIPALFDGAGNVLEADRTENYYKDAGVDAVATMVPFDANHSMVAGTAGLKAGDPLQSKNIIEWACTIEGDTGEQDNKGASTINKALNKVAVGATTCPDEDVVGGFDGVLGLLITFPNCWDGNTAFPWNNGSGGSTTNEHMRYPWQKANGRTQTKADTSPLLPQDECPRGYKTLVPELAIGVHWPVADITMRNGYVASDESGMEMEMGLADNGATAHADFMNGWDQDLLRGLVDECIIDKQKCEEDEYPECWPSACRAPLVEAVARRE